jgi:predicted nucleic acid-binding protein
MDILADTNILLRRIHRRDPQHRITQRCLNRLIQDGNRICVTSQNLIELWTVCTRPIDNNGLGLTPGQTERILARLEHSVLRLSDSDAVYPEWRRLVSFHKVAGKKAHDARLVAAMSTHGITHLLTFNMGDFARYAEITVIDPRDCATSQKS